ncbi:hypothetical protein [Gorillibacterium sp. CAU 1737]|uniref:hypothetical protein n=1 Tax=Gorillibacterium sp. CAU 1737 TaxID=3140362 RepID=UPI0032609793
MKERDCRLVMQLQMECAAYFRDHPHARETCEGLALLLRKKPEELEQVLERLMELRILEQSKDGPRSVYWYKLPDHSARDESPWTEL